ncbi:MAG: hypothetical protein Q4C42_00565 [Clostridia bacterium]|nr:hypothetical protein [Clostridia bacterium]
MFKIDSLCMAEVERKADAVRDKALAVLQGEFPDLKYVVDPYTLDDYYSGQKDKPGVIYPHFTLPKGKTEQEVIEDIVNNTRRYFAKK